MTSGSSSPVLSALWRRLDAPGHDTCRLLRLRDGGPAVAGWQLEGCAVFRHEDGRPAQLQYRVHCDEGWHAQRGTVRGWVGETAIDLVIARHADGAWTLDGSVVAGLDHCVDLDLGFTPATNLFQLRRLGLAVGAAADAPAAWIDLADTAAQRRAQLGELGQRYERRSEDTYWYTAQRFSYAALLTVTADGFVRSYPGLWEAEAEVEA